MTRLARRVVWGLAATALVVATCALVLVKLWPRGPKGVPPELVPASWAEYRLTPGHQTHVGGEKAECHDCHDFERDGFKNPGTAVCAKCHAGVAASPHHRGPSSATGCLTCHAFALGQTEPTCIGCHASTQGGLPAIVQHATIDCATCHRLEQTPSIVPATCTGCHDERDTKHARHAASNGCQDCHVGHAPAAAATTMCASCHVQAKEPHPAAHDACLSCHQPHDFVASDSACIGCHGPKTTLLGREVPAHDVCLNCHDPHAPGKAVAACAGCHQSIQVSHGTAAACTTCHAPHGDDPVAVAATCTSCHKMVAASDTGAHRGGIACEACHQPHAFGGLDEKTLCRNCHGRETMLAASNPGHADCTSCHGASVVHSIAAPVACGTCHAAEQKSAPAGHQRCVGCHEPHAGKPTPTCASCHAEKVGEPHGNLQGGCASCHRPHGPGGVAAPPACTTCHAPATLAALHTAPGHTACASCHASPHEPPHDDRVTCTGSCHADKRNHELGAQVCTGCHVFRR
ncbi:MAG: hypothetical protein ABSE49_26575 [Polyangiaceae bacterium]